MIQPGFKPATIKTRSNTILAGIPVKKKFPVVNCFDSYAIAFGAAPIKVKNGNPAVVNETNPNRNNSSQIINIETTYADTSGIVANQIALLEKSDCKISNFTSNFIPAPHSCTPIFSFNVSAHFNNNNIDSLIDDIRHQNALHDCKIDINGKHIESYEGMGF